MNQMRTPPARLGAALSVALGALVAPVAAQPPSPGAAGEVPRAGRGAAAPPEPASPGAERTPGDEERGAASASEVDEVLSLEAALAQLEVQNPSLAAARARVERAGALARQARAPLFPSAAVSGAYVRNNAEVRVRVEQLLAGLGAAPAGAPNLLIQPLDAFRATGSLRVPILSLAAWYAAEAAEAGRGVAQASSEALALKLRASFARLAHAAASLEEVVEASRRALRLAREQAQSAARRVGAGTAAPLDLLRAQTEQVGRESDLAMARAELARSRLALGVLLGRSTPLRVTVPELPGREPLEPGSQPAPPGSASPSDVERHPEMRAMRAQLQVAEAQVRAADALLLPTLQASAALFASDEPYPTGDRWGYRVGAELSVPLYDGGLRYGKRREARASEQAARAELAQRRLSLLQAAADAYRSISVADEGLRLARTRRALAAEAAASAQRSFTAGVASSLDVLSANDTLYRAEIAVAQARARSAQSRIDCAEARGELP